MEEKEIQLSLGYALELAVLAEQAAAGYSRNKKKLWAQYIEVILLLLTNFGVQIFTNLLFFITKSL